MTTEIPTTYGAIGGTDELHQPEILHTGEKNPKYAPPDRYNFAFLLLILLGMGSIFPWNFFITAADYFRYSFRNTTDPTVITPSQKLFENALSIVATSCGFLGVLINTATTRYVSFKYRIYGGFVVVTAVFIVTTILAKSDTDAWQSQFFIVTMVSVFVINLAANIVAGGLFGVQGCLPSRYATAFMVGQTVAGIFAALASVFSILATRNGSEKDKNQMVKNQAAGYFGSAIAAMVLCIVGFRFFLRLPIINYYLQPASALPIESIRSDDVGFDKPQKDKFPVKLVAKRIWSHALLLILTFFTTLAVFPAIASAVISTHTADGSLLTNSLFLPVACFIVFNAGDLAGRLSLGYLQFPNQQQGLWSLAIAVVRLGLIPLFIFCNAQPRTLPVVFGDGGYVAFVAILAFTNGYLGNLGIMYGPKLVPPQFAEVTGSLMGLCINTGLLLGSAFSFLLVHVL